MEESNDIFRAINTRKNQSKYIAVIGVGANLWEKTREIGQAYSKIRTENSSEIDIMSIS